VSVAANANAEVATTSCVALAPGPHSASYWYLDGSRSWYGPTRVARP